jgi:hypothetical protein
METAGLNVVYDLLQSTKLSSKIKGRETNNVLRQTNKIYFVICNSCYWCATYFGIDDLELLTESSSYTLDCHVCKSHSTELIPIGTDESFRIQYNVSRGMEIEFYRRNRIAIKEYPYQ